MSATLVAAPVDTTSDVAGTHLLESLVDLSAAIRSENWLDATLSGVGTVLDAAAAVMDPIGSLISAGLGWLMEHMEPLKGWLSDLTGDAGAVLGFAATWDNIAAELDLAAGDYTRVLRADVGGMSGAGVQAYVRHGEGVAADLRGLTSASSAVGSALRTASTVVQAVRELVRDALTDLVGAAISWTLQTFASAGLATPWVAAQVATRVSSLVARVGGKVTAVVRSMTALRGLVSELDGVLAGFARLLVRPRGGIALEPVARSSARGARDPGVYSGGEYRPRPSRDILGPQWAEETYKALRTDDHLAASISHAYPQHAPDDVARALKHVLHDEHLLGSGHGAPFVGRFHANPAMADAILRLRRGEATPEDHILVEHEIAESAYVRDHPGSTYEEAHAYANGIANWEAAMQGTGEL